MNDRTVRFEALFRTHDRGQGLVVNLDHIDSILGDGSRLSDYDCHRLAHITYFSFRQWPGSSRLKGRVRNKKRERTVTIP
jgi:hypothetical protein